MKTILLATLLASCATNTAPKMQKIKKLSLWSTFYYIPSYSNDKSGIPLRDENNNKLGVALDLGKMCNAQLQGSVLIDNQMYGYWTKKVDKYQVDCKAISNLIKGTVKFRKEKTKYGSGVYLWPLTPFKSIAVDRNYIPYGSKVFIPVLKGIEYIFENKKYTHDGVVIAQDTGGAIKGNHIDFFLGPVKGSGTWKDALPIVKPFKFIQSKPSKTFEAWIIK